MELNIIIIFTRLGFDKSLGIQIKDINQSRLERVKCVV